MIFLLLVPSGKVLDITVIRFSLISIKIKLKNKLDRIKDIHHCTCKVAC